MDSKTCGSFKAQLGYNLQREAETIMEQFYFWSDIINQSKFLQLQRTQSHFNPLSPLRNLISFLFLTKAHTIQNRGHGVCKSKYLHWEDI